MQIELLEIHDHLSRHPPFDTLPEAAVAALNQGIERQVRACPSQYMWSMKRFKKRPPGAAKLY